MWDITLIFHMLNQHCIPGINPRSHIILFICWWNWFVNISLRSFLITNSVSLLAINQSLFFISPWVPSWVSPLLLIFDIYMLFNSSIHHFPNFIYWDYLLISCTSVIHNFISSFTLSAKDIHTPIFPPHFPVIISIIYTLTTSRLITLVFCPDNTTKSRVLCLQFKLKS